MFYLPKIST
jgi:hypothetical protein